MSATPHNGKEQDFQLFMALLDGDRFEGKFRDGVHVADVEDMMRRLTKEELLRFDGRPLFPERKAYTVKYELSVQEAELYTAVTEYVRNEMNRVQRFAEEDGRKRNNVGFALQILQRRLASSPAAIYQSLKRRRERLEGELSEAKLSSRGQRVNLHSPKFPDDIMQNMEEYDQDEIDDLEDMISSGASSAETVEQLEIEVQKLKGLEQMALGVFHSGQDTKWQQLDRILDDDLMTDPDGYRRKLIIFTEPKDTLQYLRDKVTARLGKPQAVDVIYGGVTREERRKVVERFMQDRDLLVLIANDAAGEGVNLQRGHLMVNYDLPWNPNKIEQRFGRIHRIGQTEVCHLWNLVAKDTREGEVYARLLEKLETARSALGGRVYDVLGELFEDKPLRELLFEAIQYNDDEEVQGRLFEVVDGAVDQSYLMELLKKRQLTNDTMPEAHVEELRLEMERAEAQRLQPHHIQSFFAEAFKRLGGKIKKREEGRWEVTHVPLIVRDRDRQIGRGIPLQKKYERICFEKDKINQQPVASFVYPGHPLLEAVIDLVREQNGHLMKQGAVLVDDTDNGTDVSVLFLLEHSVQDGRQSQSGKPNNISQRLQFASINSVNQVTNAGIAPHLNLRPATTDEIDLVNSELNAEWLRKDLEKAAVQFATIELAQSHVAEVKARRIPEIDKVEFEVKARLSKEINYWDGRAAALREEEKAGRKVRLNWKNAERRAEDLAERLKRRMEIIQQERLISAQPPRIRGGMVVVPKGLLETKTATAVGPNGFSEDADARRKIEVAAIDAVMAVERDLGNEPKSVEALKIGYDIQSYDPNTGHMRFIEVKGRVDTADTIMITRQEVITSLHEPEKFILAIVQVADGQPIEPRYVRGSLDTREPPFDQNAIQFNMKRLLESGGGSSMNQPHKKKLIEVAIPLEAINTASAREKSIRHGHPSTLHLWWARRPLAACRAVLFAQLVDDPSSHPDTFPTEEAVETERKRLFNIIEELVKWENSTNEEVLDRAATEIRKSCGNNLPPIHDPFSGGGSIPLEAQRLGLPAYGTDLNPVAVLIGQSMLEFPSVFKDKEPINPGLNASNFYRNSMGLAEDVAYYGTWLKDQAFQELKSNYPKVKDSVKGVDLEYIPIAWIWARTVPSPDPAFSHLNVPLASTFVLDTRTKIFISPTVDRHNGEIRFNLGASSDLESYEKAKSGTKNGRGANFNCLYSGSAITPDYVKECGKSGRLGHMLLAVVAESKSGKAYFPANDFQKECKCSSAPSCNNVHKSA